MNTAKMSTAGNDNSGPNFCRLEIQGNRGRIAPPLTSLTNFPCSGSVRDNRTIPIIYTECVAAIRPFSHFRLRKHGSEYLIPFLKIRR
jgi:hypothetical protein